MRRRQWLLALLLGLLVLAGCGQKTTQPSPEEPTPPAAENAAPVETPEESEPAEAVPDDGGGDCAGERGICRHL